MSARHCREIGKMGAEHEQSDSDRIRDMNHKREKLEVCGKTTDFLS